MKIAKKDLQALLDIATSSLDFGSGFLEDDDVTVIRKVAQILDLDPWVFTPTNWRHKYPHEFYSQAHHRASVGLEVDLRKEDYLTVFYNKCYWCDRIYTWKAHN